MDDDTLIFAFFNEIGIVSQLSQAFLNRHLPDGLHSSHFATLNHLYRVGEGTTPLAIANAMQVTKATMTHTLSVLEKRALVEIRANPRDGRSKRVFLTPAGRAFRLAAIGDVTRALATVSSLFDRAELEASLPALQRVRKILDAERANRPDGR
ncbi:MarR family transcriptional regulator [Ensifer sp.]|uniref:MarR family winged helix-turn-helix transcriptional regulator n=1 Tax=Ensifer sp. TaxID=1872086 RepID=UPI0028A2A6CB|nr:MarR family transcriptional regulator [Ensifer sp.]